MGKVLRIEDEEQLDKSHPGCMSGIFHALDYHCWLSNRAKRNRRYKRISNDDHDPLEVIKLLDTKTSHILVDQDFVSSPKLQRTHSIHHLETNEWVHPIIFFPENVAESKMITNPETQDILDIFEVDKELFVNTLHDRSLSLDTKPKLTKSGSFPTANKSVSRNLMPMKLKDKLNEIYTKSKAGKMKNSNDGLNCKNIISLRRISSLNESATRFLDFSVGKEVALRHSRSLKSHSTAFCEDEFALKIEGDGYQISGKSTKERPVLLPEYRSLDEKVQILKGFQENVEEFKTINNKKHMESSTKDDDFTYVKKILERSGFITNSVQQTWCSSNQRLDPFVFQEIESHYFYDPERFAEEVNAVSHRLLIFDLVDEVLIAMHERLLTYYAKKPPPSPTGTLVLDEVWGTVNRLLNFKHEINESLNDIVSQDFRSEDGWMNLQLDFECVGLDLEDLILDEVLEELVFKLI